MSKAVRRGLWILTLAATVALADGEAVPASRPVDPTQRKLAILRFRRELASVAAKRKAAVEGLLALGAEGRTVLAAEAARLAELHGKLARTSLPAAASATAAAVRAHSRWQDAVHDAMRRVRSTAKGDTEGIQRMLKSTDRAEKRYEQYLARLKAAMPRVLRIRAAARRINEYEQARARAEDGYTPAEHTVAGLAREAKVAYDPAIEKVIDDERRAQKIAAWVAKHNRKLKDKIDRQEYEVLGLLNRYRRRMGRLPLALSAPLYKAASQHAKEMRDRDYFSHDSPVAQYATPAKRAAWAGYEQARSVGENIAMGTTDGARAYKMWCESPPHHRNLLGAAYREVGVARAGRHWTQLFGARSKPPWEADK